jgi:hypothetical protein
MIRRVDSIVVNGLLKELQIDKPKKDKFIYWSIMSGIYFMVGFFIKNHSKI